MRVRLALFSVFALSAALVAQDRRIQPIVARKQVALVIGNAAYSNGPLANSVRDAEAMAARLRQLGYDVSLVTNAGRKSMGQALDDFVGKLGTGDVGFFYYSGHGVQVEGENYLIPVDFQGKDETDVRYDTHPISRVQERMERSGAQLSILVLDACRDNPFHSATRSAGGGLAAMSGGRGTFIAFATSPGKTASDNSGGKNGLFTQYLLEGLSVKGLGLGEVFDYVRERVDMASSGKQLPWTLSSVVGRYTFLPSETVAPEAPSAAISTAVPSPHAFVRTGDVKVNAKDGLKYVWIAPGSFTMGCSPNDGDCLREEGPAHPVNITKGFWMGQTLVTVGAWKKYSADTGKPPLRDRDSSPRRFNESAGDDNLPATLLNWNEARDFCAWSGGRLPGEAEWEFAARAGTTGPRYGNIDAIAWDGDNSGRARLDASAIMRTDQKSYSQRLFDNGNNPHPVAQKQANAWGVYDMLGSMYQWTADWFDENYYARSENRDPIGPSSGQYRVLRGASWTSEPRHVRASYRRPKDPNDRTSVYGLRCAED